MWTTEICTDLLANASGQLDVCWNWWTLQGQDKYIFIQGLPHHAQSFFSHHERAKIPENTSFGCCGIVSQRVKGYQYGSFWPCAYLLIRFSDGWTRCVLQWLAQLALVLNSTQVLVTRSDHPMYAPLTTHDIFLCKNDDVIIVHTYYFCRAIYTWGSWLLASCSSQRAHLWPCLLFRMRIQDRTSLNFARFAVPAQVVAIQIAASNAKGCCPSRHSIFNVFQIFHEYWRAHCLRTNVCRVVLTLTFLNAYLTRANTFLQPKHRTMQMSNSSCPTSFHVTLDWTADRTKNTLRNIFAEINHHTFRT